MIQLNLKCAKFLEWKPAFAHEADRYGYIQTVDGFSTPFYNNSDPQLVESNQDLTIHSISELKFHSDWNWIMEVIEKIESLGYATSLSHNYVISNYGNDCFKIDTKSNAISAYDDKPIQFSLTKGKKEATIESIDRFIDWYNKQK